MTSFRQRRRRPSRASTRRRSARRASRSTRRARRRFRWSKAQRRRGAPPGPVSTRRCDDGAFTARRCEQVCQAQGDTRLEQRRLFALRQDQVAQRAAGRLGGHRRGRCRGMSLSRAISRGRSRASRTERPRRARLLSSPPRNSGSQGCFTCVRSRVLKSERQPRALAYTYFGA